MSASDNPAPTGHLGIPAATLVIFRNGPAGTPPELLMVTRARNMRFAGGAAVFPGGRIDPADRELALALAPLADVDEVAARIGAIRETLEETGLALGLEQPVSAEGAAAARAMLIETGALAPVLERFGWRLRLDALVPFARWCPAGMHVRVFDTRFYLADLGTGAVSIAVDQTENTQLFWTTAAGALDMAENGAISIIFPTQRNLERLAQFSSFDEARDDAGRYPVQTIKPWVAQIEGEEWLCIPDDAGYPISGVPLRTVDRG